ncbi:hypothetical protein [Kitasatospora aureofaciens]|uniref:hypothetical protein n=1 Tax=Kitasatospora aureofaciens TaxID=1894 RepID=UPI003402CE22
MSLTPLATVTDVANRMPRALTTAEQTRATTLLVDASSRIRAHCRQAFTQVQTTEIIAPVDNQIILPQRPVISVDAVARVNADGRSFMPYSVWTWDGKATLMLGPPSAIVNAPAVWTDMDWFWRNVTYQVTYTHGYSVIPDDVVGVAAGMVARVLMAPGSPGVISETIGGYAYRMADGFPTAQVDLTSADEKILKSYCGRRNRTIELR